MNKFILPIALIVLIFTSSVFSQVTLLKREMRSAWIATVTNLDWPNSPGNSTDAQKQQMIDLLNELKNDGVNTIFFQVRTECDALYSSAHEPWSYWLTGVQGFPPSPYYDPLQFTIEEAHKRGMEVHAWFNPYRADRSVGSYTKAASHVTNTHPEWVLQISTLKFLNPGIPEVRQYIKSVIGDIVSNFDVDGIHFDDYFYPYPPNNMTASSANNALDNAAFAADPRGFVNKDNWRRDNINIMVQMVYDTIQTIKPYVKLGSSPFGIWKNGVPSGITGMDAYSVIYADAMAWLQAGSVDYLTPQLYWPFGGGQDYGKLQPWWADSVAAYNKHYYPGHAYYRVSTWTNPSELPNQIRLDRLNPKVHGGVFFRAKNYGENPRGVTDSLRNDLYKYQSLNPVMSWKDIVVPNAPRNLTFERLPSGQAGLNWDAPLAAPDGDTAKRYVVYRFNTSNIQPSDLENPVNIFNIEGNDFSIPGNPPSPTGPYYFVVTALDRNYNESVMSSILQVNPPPVPLLALPANGANNLSEVITLVWNYPDLASAYSLQISTDPTFATGIVTNLSSLTDTSRVITGLSGATTYYWRVNSSNAGGTSNFSTPFSFTTGYPSTTALFWPLNNTGSIPKDSSLIWYSTPSTQTYDLKFARSADFSVSTIVKDTTGLTDTTLVYSNLVDNTWYFWKVRAINLFGTGNWSETWKFKTLITDLRELPAIVEDYSLEQNYPNPFNPSTNIRFSILEGGNVSLKIYNLLGQEVLTLINNDFMNNGAYEYIFEASGLPSGVYFYQLTINDFSSSKKMILMK